MLRAFKPLFLVLSGEILPRMSLFPFPCLWPGQSSPDSCGLLSTLLLPFLLPSPSFCWRSGLEGGGAVCPEMFWGLAAGGGTGWLYYHSGPLLSWGREEESGRAGHLPLAPGYWSLERTSSVGVDIADLAQHLIHHSDCHFHLGG